MNARGQYGSCEGQRRTYVGARLVHTIELKQRYDNVKIAAVQTLLSELSSVGVTSSSGPNRWEIALKDGAWVYLVWYPDYSALEVTITDRELRAVDEAGPRSSTTHVRHLYEAILRKITPRLQTYGATTIGAATYAGTVVGDHGAYGWGQYGSSREMVGITLYHSVGDRADAVRQMAIDWSALYQNLASEVGEVPADPSHVDWSKRPQVVQKAREEEVAAWKAIDALPEAQRPEAVKRARELTWRRGQLYVESFDPKKVAWWNSYAKPQFKLWSSFKREQLGDRTLASDYIAFAERFQTSWDVYEDWKKKLDKLRAEAEKRGFMVAAPKPQELPTTVWADVATTVERGAGKVAAGIGDVWNLFKYGAWAVLGIGAAVAVSSIVSNLRRGKDPAEKYVEMIREGRRSRASRALPARLPQRALPPGRTTEDA